MDQGVAPADIAPAIAALLPRDLTPWGMFMSADIVVKAVMVGLAFASVLTWTVWLVKAYELFALKRRLRRSLADLAECRALAEAQSLSGSGVVGRMIAAASEEVELSGHQGARLSERVASRLERIEASAIRSVARGTGILATVGATAPFVGLFGTVWGVMNSFIGISKAQTTNLAVVAPGIAEALLATGMGLFAAIPAVVIYNMLSRATAGYRALVGDASAAVAQLVSRDMDLAERPDTTTRGEPRGRQAARY
jgi:biopolymer transport protein ExbB